MANMKSREEDDDPRKWGFHHSNNNFHAKWGRKGWYDEGELLRCKALYAQGQLDAELGD